MTNPTAPALAEAERIPSPCPLCGREPQRATLESFGYATNSREKTAVVCGRCGLMAQKPETWNKLVSTLALDRAWEEVVEAAVKKLRARLSAHRKQGACGDEIEECTGCLEEIRSLRRAAGKEGA